MYSKIILFFITTLCVHAQYNECNLTSCMLQGGQLGWDQTIKQWECHALVRTYNDENYHATNKDKCEKKGHLYRWDGYAFQCLSSKKFVPIRSLPDPIDVAQRQLECNKQKGAFGFNDNKSNFECYKIAYKDPVTLGKGFERYQEKLCVSKGYKYIGELSNDEWTCVIKNTSTKSKTKAQQHDELYQRKRACEYIDKTLKWNKNNQKWECLDSVKTVSILPDQTIKQPINVPSVSNIVQGEPQERRTMCEQRGFYFLWDSSINNWQCFKHVDKLEDVEKNSSYINNCVTLGLSYMELEKNKWGCVDSVLKLEEQPLSISFLKPKCDKQHGELIWKDHRWICATKSTKEEIEKAQTPSLKSPTPLMQEKAKLGIKSHTLENIYGIAFTPDQKYLMTRTSTNTSAAIRVYDMESKKETFTLNTGVNRRSFFHKYWIILFDNNEPLEIIDIRTKKKIYSLPYERISSLVITDDDKKLFIFHYHTPLICWDLIQNKLLYTVNVRKIHWSSGLNIIPESTQFHYENSDGQAAVFNIKTGQDITPTPSTPPEKKSTYKRIVNHPANTPSELNTSRNEIYYSPDQIFAVELAQKDFHVWNLKLGTKIYSHPISINRYEAPVLTNTHAVFHHRTSLNTSALYLFELAHPEKLIRLNYNPITISSFGESKKQDKLFQITPTLSFDLQNATVMQSANSSYTYKETIYQNRYFSDGKRVALATRGNEVILYDLLNQKELTRFGGGQTSHPTSSIQVELSPDESKIVATANLDRNIMVWDINKSSLDYTILNPAGWSNPFAITPDGKYIVALSRSPSDGESRGYLGYSPDQGNLNVWNFKTGILERTLPIRATTFALIPQTHLVALGENAGAISIWDYRNGLERFRLTGHEQQIDSLTFIHNGHTLLSRDAQSKMIHWDYIQNDPKGTKMWHGIPYRTELSHDSNYMLIAQEEYKKEGKIRLLNLKTSQYEYEFTYPTSYAMLRQFSDDDRYFFLSTPENATKVFETATGKELATLQAYDNGEWIIMTPDGYFNTSPQGREFITDPSGNPIDDTTYNKYFKPDKVKESLNPKEKK